MRQPRLVVTGADRVLPSHMAMTDRDELTLVLFAERSARPAAGDDFVEHGLELDRGPRMLLEARVERPEGILPALLFAGDVPEQRVQLDVLAVHRPENEDHLVEHARRQLLDPELARGHV